MSNQFLLYGYLIAKFANTSVINEPIGSHLRIICEYKSILANIASFIVAPVFVALLFFSFTLPSYCSNMEESHNKIISNQERENLQVFANKIGIVTPGPRHEDKTYWYSDSEFIRTKY